MAVTKHPSGCQCRRCLREAKARRRRSKRVGVSFQTFFLILIATLAIAMLVSVSTDSRRPEHVGWVSR